LNPPTKDKKDRPEPSAPAVDKPGKGGKCGKGGKGKDGGGAEQVPPPPEANPNHDPCKLRTPEQLAEFCYFHQKDKCQFSDEECKRKKTKGSRRRK